MSDNTVIDTSPSDIATGGEGGMSEDAAMGAAYQRMVAEGIEMDGPENQASLEGEEGAEREGPEPEKAEPVAEEQPAPAHLPSAIKEAWGDIPANARDAIATLTRENDRKFAEMGRQMAEIRPVTEKLNYAIESFPEFRGLTPAQLADGAVQLAAIQAKLESGTPESRAQTVLEIAQTYGVLPQLQATITGQPVSLSDQQAMRMQQELAALKAQSQNGALTQEQIEEKISLAMAQRDSERLVEQFAAANPLYADVEEILPQFIEIAAERQPGLQGDALLQAGYEMAINALPEARAKRDALEAKTATAAATDSKRTEQAKRAASINVKSTSAGKPAPLSEEDQMRAVWRKQVAS